jgi:hypothetical protein
LSGAGKEGERKALTRGPGVAAGEVSACVRRALRAKRGWQVGLRRDAVGEVASGPCAARDAGACEGDRASAETGRAEEGCEGTGPE